MAKKGKKLTAAEKTARKANTVPSNAFLDMWEQAIQDDILFEEFVKRLGKKWDVLKDAKKVKQKCYALNSLIAANSKSADNPYGVTLKIPASPTSSYGDTLLHIQGNLKRWLDNESVKKKKGPSEKK